MQRAVMTSDLFSAAAKRNSAVDIVIRRMKLLLIQRQLQPGELLPGEYRLAESLGASRGSVREAMKVLSAFGIVEIRRGNGTFIANSAKRRKLDPLLFGILLSAGGREDLVELRRVLETGITELVIKHSSEEDLGRLVESYLELEEEIYTKADASVLAQADVKFHFVMASIAKNEMLEQVYHYFAETFTPTMNGNHALEPHRLILEAVMKRDLSLAHAAVEMHTRIWQHMLESRSDPARRTD